ncbi:hypothetical protein [Bacillus alveayuensis]|jgi:hypothetical protein|uniref:hypothetical protein n=1 Tax=Aeribacillus alveayuensis TaxID=279215 RepID=UPI0005D13062|nr:hypothetical protein [Bacillus alveayuensis]
MNNWDPYISNQIPYNKNFHMDEDREETRNVNEPGQNMEPMSMMENVPMPTMPAAYPKMAPMMPAAYPHTLPTMPMDCGCHYPSSYHYPTFTGQESTMPWTHPTFPMMMPAQTMMPTSMPSMGQMLPTASYPAGPFMHGHFPMMTYGYHPYYSYR